jgi:hypothetical protein
MSQKAQLSDAERSRLQKWLGIPTNARAKVYKQISASTEITSLTYWLEIFFSPRSQLSA